MILQELVIPTWIMTHPHKIKLVRRNMHVTCWGQGDTKKCDEYTTLVKTQTDNRGHPFSMLTKVIRKGTGGISCRNEHQLQQTQTYYFLWESPTALYQKWLSGRYGRIFNNRMCVCYWVSEGVWACVCVSFFIKCFKVTLSYMETCQEYLIT